MKIITSAKRFIIIVEEWIKKNLRKIYRSKSETPVSQKKILNLKKNINKNLHPKIALFFLKIVLWMKLEWEYYVFLYVFLN